jgi:acetylornithine/succinyldiaminopimelate/putrescine aminotransferase
MIQRDDKGFYKYVFQATQHIDPILTKGKGSWVWDTNKKRYLDLNAGQFCVVLGHSNKKFNKLIRKSLNKLVHTNTNALSSTVLKASEELSRTTFGLFKKSIFLSTGAEANEFALRYAKFINNREIVLSLGEGYHGLTYLTQGLSSEGAWAIPKVESAISLLTPNSVHFDSTIILDSKNDLIEKIERYKEKVSAVIIEPILGTSGIIEIPKDYLVNLRQLCDKYSIILIFDECQTGFGRTGSWYAYQTLEVVPDVLCLSKALGNGFPVASVSFRDGLIDKVEGKITHFSSHQNDPLAADIIAFNIKYIQKNDLLARVSSIGHYLIKELNIVSEETKGIVNVRGKGLMIGFDLAPIFHDDLRGNSQKLIKAMENEGVLLQVVRKGLTFRVLPNYHIKRGEIDFFIKALNKVLNSLIDIKRNN